MQHMAVFTGDIVRSTDMGTDELQRMFAALEVQSDMIGHWPESSSIFQRFRGDGWQMSLPARYALRAAAVMRATARATGKGHDTRIGIGVGLGTVKGNDLAAADGPVFVQSGHALDRMKRGPLMTAPAADDLLRIALPPIDRIVQGWTAKQAQIAAVLLSPDAPTHDTLAARLGQTRQLVQKQAESAGLSALLESFEIIEQSCASTHQS
ncbi:hypothetical protein [uncultured Sulfitobacter sp.]|uniref:hypothetical protein n=1 Tax=uncultured Sulfitobacter sp. TaxID=191468 RepID=UPI00261E90AA|nr:hypothetical protein [uncultured Sulfitobacter sp.]